MVILGGKNRPKYILWAMVSRPAGITTFLIETEAELDESKISRFNIVGVTAGASTPNWMIMRVVKKLEEIEKRRRRGIQKIYSAAEFFIRSNLYIALGAAFLTYGISYLSGIEPSVYFMVVSFLYFFSMYNINHIADKDSMRLNEPDRIEFYEKNRDILLKIGVTASLVSLVISVYFGFTSFLLMLISVCLGIAYSVKIFPSYISKYTFSF